MKRIIIAAAAALFVALPAVAQNTIETVVGNYDPTGSPGVAVPIPSPAGVARDSIGNVYFSAQHEVLRLDASGIIHRVAGNVQPGFSGDGGAATSALLSTPSGVAVDAAGNLFIADYDNHRIRKVDTGGIITTVAGDGPYGFSGDGGAATSALLSTPSGVAVDAAGNLFIADTDNHRIRKVDTGGIITTVAGTGTSGFSGDGGAATSASLVYPRGVAVDAAGNLFIADYSNNRIRKVDTGGIITTVAGDGTYGFSGDGGAATSASLYSPYGVAVDAAGNLFIADRYNNRIRKVGPGGIITTVAGGTSGFFGDGGAATSASLYYPQGVAVDAAGNLFIADYSNNRIRKVDTGGIITTVAGDGIGAFFGDGGAAISARLANPQGVAVDAAGNLFIADYSNNRIRKVDTDGIITTVAGTGTSGFSGDNGAATSAALGNPYGVAVDAAGNLFIVHYNRIRKVDTYGIITTVAGTTRGSGGDGGAAISARFNGPSGVAVDVAGNLFIADTHNRRIRKVDTGGIITTVAGNGTYGFSGDGGAATSASLDYPRGVAVDAAGNLFIADYSNNRIRKVDTGGIITTVAGDGTYGFSGDGGAATSASLYSPYGVAVDAAGNLFIADRYNNRIRKVGPGGIITTVAGNGTYGFSGDGGAATSARLASPYGVAVDAAGNLFIADTANHRIRRVLGVGAGMDGTPPVVNAAVSGSAGNAGWYTSSVTVVWTVTDAESAVTSTSGCDSVTVANDTAGTTFTCSATSAGGTTTESVSVKCDTTPPAISVTTPVQGAIYALNAVVAADYTCSDSLSGVAGCDGPVANGAFVDTGTVGPGSFTVNATDAAGNAAAVTRDYDVRYVFEGFLQPVDNLPVINEAKAGRTLPLKWRIKDAGGALVTDTGTLASLLSGPIACDASPATIVEEQLASPGSTVFRYDETSNQFIYNWKSSSGWRGCRQLQVQLADGTYYHAKFRFK